MYTSSVLIQVIIILPHEGFVFVQYLLINTHLSKLGCNKIYVKNLSPLNENSH